MLPGPQEDNPDPTFGKASAESTIIITIYAVIIVLVTFASLVLLIVNLPNLDVLSMHYKILALDFSAKSEGRRTIRFRMGA